MLNRILTLALMLSVVICCIFVFTEDPPELEQTGPLPILMYHDVTDGPTSDNPMVVTMEKLEGGLVLAEGKWLSYDPSPGADSGRAAAGETRDDHL